jgi:sec-independent protein translocase protein TatA
VTGRRRASCADYSSRKLVRRQFSQAVNPRFGRSHLNTQGGSMFANVFMSQAVIAMLGFGIQELLIVAFIVLILFGSRLPSVMRSLGQGVVEFKKGVQGIEDEKDNPRET